MAVDGAEAEYERGNAFMSLGRFAEAAACYEAALRQRPDHAETLNNLGVALAEQGQWAAAIDRYDDARRLNPLYAAAHFNRGNALVKAERAAEAIASYQEALRLNPAWAGAHLNLGLAFIAQERFDDAIACYERALQLRPNYAETYNNLGLARQAQGRFDDAMTGFDQALRCQRDFAPAWSNRGQLLLLLGHWQRGWREYEWRCRLPAATLTPLPPPRWDGALLHGRTVLLRAEQGLGDTLQFIRYAPLVRKMGGRVVVECPPSLIPLLKTCPGIDDLAARGAALPQIDFQVPLPSLPGLFGTTPATVPTPMPYLFAQPALEQKWQQELAAIDGFKIGIAWQGSRGYPHDRQRSMPLRHFAALAAVPGVRLISLQKGPGSEQVREVEHLFPIVDLGPRLDEAGGAFLDSAAVLKCLDLIVCADTSLGHLAGAMGLPYWLALPLSPDWRWLLNRDDSPWYPSVRLFRQKTLGGWDDVFARMATALRERLATPPRTEPILVGVSAGELIDKITILEIKNAQLTDAAKLSNVRTELALTAAVRDRHIRPSAQLAALTADLKAVNEALWRIEDEIRACEHAGAFGNRFIELARSVYRQNDRRSQLKREINQLLGSALIEEKGYAAY